MSQRARRRWRMRRCIRRRSRGCRRRRRRHRTCGRCINVKHGVATKRRRKTSRPPPHHRRASLHGPGSRVQPLHQQFPTGSRQIHLDRAPLWQINQIFSAGRNRIGQAIAGACQVISGNHRCQIHPVSVTQDIPHILTQTDPIPGIRVTGIGRPDRRAVIRVHKDHVQPPRETLPGPLPIPADPPQMIRIRNNDLRPGSRRRVIHITTNIIGGNPIGRTGK